MGKVYACSDLHGMYELWKQIENYLQEDDRLIFLGDAADRGEKGLQIMLELLADPRVTYLKGNHEDIMIQACNSPMTQPSFELALWLQNGGYSTWQAFEELSISEKWDLISKLEDLQQIIIYKNQQGKTILLSHAGTEIKNIAIENENIIINNIDDVDFLWDRTHFYEIFNPNIPLYDENLYIVHGHTPTQILNKKICGTYSDNEICVYCKGHKIDIDTGCFASKQIALLDLDTLEPIYFRLEEGPDGVSR